MDRRGFLKVSGNGLEVIYRINNADRYDNYDNSDYNKVRMKSYHFM